ncbi:MAG: thioredoxin domain-containing protein [bacterium]|nr:thioredoxin domain-containing protein [bacterium]
MKHYLHLTIALLLLSACSDSSSDISSRTPKGNPNAAVVITEYADLQCPACSAAHKSITAPLLEKYGNSIALVHMHFPLRSIHRYALDASEASECAADQGKFWEFVDIAFENQKDLSLDVLDAWAEELNLDLAAFGKCMKSHAKRDTVLADYEMGRKAEVAGTPSFFVNDKKVDTGFDSISAAVDAELARLTQRL